MEENWSFLKDVRRLAKRYGPDETRFDLINEGAPSDYLDDVIARQMSSYVATMYRQYARAFGTADVVVSVIGPESVFDNGNRLRNLIETLRATGFGLPRWFEVHLNDTGSDVLHGLLATERVLSSHHLDQPIVIGEAANNDPPTARALASFMRRSKRLEEVLPWYTQPGRACNASPPYRVDAYLRLARSSSNVLSDAP